MTKLIRDTCIDAQAFDDLLQEDDNISFERCLILDGIDKIDSNHSVRFTDCCLRNVVVASDVVNVYFNNCLLCNCAVGNGNYNNYYDTTLVRCTTSPLKKGEWYNSTVIDCTLCVGFFKNLICSTHEIILVKGCGSAGRLVVYLAKEDRVLCGCWGAHKVDTTLDAFAHSCAVAYEQGYHNAMQRDTYQQAIELFRLAREYHKKELADSCKETPGVLKWQKLI